MERTEGSKAVKTHVPTNSFVGPLLLPGAMMLIMAFGCATAPNARTTAVIEEGRDVVRLEQVPGVPQYTHPVKLSPNDIKTLLRGVRAWERRNAIHELLAGEAVRKRAFREEELAELAPKLSQALAQAGPSDRVYFHLSLATEAGDEETTTGWIYVQEPVLHLVLSEVHDLHGPQPDISKYDRQMPNVPELPGPFNITFEPEQYLIRVVSTSPWFSPEQHERLEIDYRKALPALAPESSGDAPAGGVSPRQ
jgi:hypothetical protein